MNWLARACGVMLAELGWTVMTGGYEGAMGEVSRGAREAGGRVIGVTTPLFADRIPNEALHEEWTEPDYLARMSTLLRQGQAFVGLPGGLGTLSECLAATCLASIASRSTGRCSVLPLSCPSSRRLSSVWCRRCRSLPGHRRRR